ncbi:UbiA family prenyltransferase [Aquabacterium sp. J223]|uniref:UbiA family prenyltransferase n=1 Tax=Aquabacterium sp. J223 TaxID=2898431 RepID=UPI0021AD83C0|nr:UbiA family prenyltransferase [Aquabacterium sp. J223]UUX96843.1 UbiA family prenyltransferase [Aquabacterium sp. J223]
MNAHTHAPRLRDLAHEPPVVVDLDGTLSPSDSLWESVLRIVKRRPLDLFWLLLSLLQGRAAFKRRVAQRLGWSGESLPINDELLAFLKVRSENGCRLVLATAADQRIAHTVARQIGLFDAVLASDGAVNLKGKAKLQAIRRLVGEDFIYAGDSRADLPIWQAARGAVLVDVAPGVRRAVVAGGTPITGEFRRTPPGVRTWARALRLHQWTKNVLVAVPLLTAFSFTDPRAVLATVLAFIAFGLVASSTYLLNDLLDLDSDREHPRKRHRPMASGAISIPAALGAMVGLMAAGLAIAAALRPAFLACILAYTALTLLYSLLLKRHTMIDVIALASLYTLRIVAGAAAIAVPLSNWLLSFSVLIFLSLALVKRCAELIVMQQASKEQAAGRSYQVADLRVLWPMGAASAVAAVVVFGLFISAPETQARFAAPDFIWLAGLGVLYWVSRLWIRTSRGEMHDDPIVFALRDGVSRLTLAWIVGMFAVAHFWVWS